MTKSNPQLQQRAGRNVPAYFGFIEALALEEFRLPSGDLVILETADGLDQPGLTVLGSSGNFLDMQNKTGVDQTFSLYYMDPEGSITTVAVDSVGPVTNGSFGSLPNALSSLPPLAPGCKYVLRAAGAAPATALDGVRTLRAASRTSDAGFVRWLLAGRVGSSFVAELPKGVTGAGMFILLGNYSGVALTYTLTLIAADGYTLSVSAPAPLPAGALVLAQQASIARGMRVQVDIQGAPAGGYVFGAVNVQALNDYPAQPPLP